jgi:hypothetical protein
MWLSFPMVQLAALTIHWELLSGDPAAPVQGPAPATGSDPFGSGWQCVPGIDVLWRVRGQLRLRWAP